MSHHIGLQQLFSELQKPAPDPIFALNNRYNAMLAEYRNGKCAEPFNLGIGKYVNKDGKTPMLKSIKEAAEKEWDDRVSDRTTGGYQALLGHAPLLRAVEELIFGSELVSDIRSSGTLVSAQAIGGTGANFLQGCLLSRLKVKDIAVSSPTWGNHFQIFPLAGLKVSTYNYYDNKTCSIPFDNLLSQIRALPQGSAVDFHGCCHNPTGMDFTEEQWLEILKVVKESELVAVFDVAYAGFGRGLSEDMFSVRQSIKLGIPTLVAFSFSKIASLYEERLGVMTVALPSGYITSEVLSTTLENIVRASVSNCQALFARAMAAVLTTPDLRAKWEEELSLMSADIKNGGVLLARELDKFGINHGGIDKKSGLFAMLPFSPETVERIEKQGVFMMSSGRINLAALKEHNVQEIASRIASVVAG